MNLSISEANAEIARLVAAKADRWQIAAARERRAVAQRREEERETARLLERIDEAEGCGVEPDFRLSWEEFRLLRAELRRLKGDAQRTSNSAQLARTRETQSAALQAVVVNLRGRKA